MFDCFSFFRPHVAVASRCRRPGSISRNRCKLARTRKHAAATRTLPSNLRVSRSFAISATPTETKKKKKSRGGEPAALFFSAAAAAVARRANSYRLTMRKRTRNSTLVSFPLPNETGTQERFFFFFFSFFAGGSLSFKATRGFPIFSAPLLRPKIELSSAAASACSVCPRSMRRRTATEGDWLSRGRRVSHITFLLLLYPFPEVT